MTTPKTESAIWFTFGWEQAYERRAGAYFGPMPPDEHKRMVYARSRADISFARENAQRTVNGKNALWDGSINTLLEKND